MIPQEKEDYFEELARQWEEQLKAAEKLNNDLQAILDKAKGKAKAKHDKVIEVERDIANTLFWLWQRTGIMVDEVSVNYTTMRIEGSEHDIHATVTVDITYKDK